MYKGSIWKTEAAYWGWLRGEVRRIWADYPVAKNFKSSSLMPIPKEMKPLFHPSTKKVGQCVQCKKWFSGSRLQIDHIEETDGCKNYKEFHNFVDRMCMISYEEMALICKPCHKNKSHAARYEMTYEEAVYTRQAIAVIKEKKDKEFLEEKGIVPAGNAKKRREQLIKYFKSVG